MIYLNLPQRAGWETPAHRLRARRFSAMMRVAGVILIGTTPACTHKITGRPENIPKASSVPCKLARRSVSTPAQMGSYNKSGMQTVLEFGPIGDRIMVTSLESLVQCGTKLWLDSVDPDEV